MYKHSYEYIQDLLSFNSVLTATDGQLSSLNLTISGRQWCTCYIKNIC